MRLLYRESPASPPVGSGFSWNYATGVSRVLAVQVTFTTDAVVANRFLVARLTDPDGVTYAESPASGAVVAASLMTAFLYVNAPVLASGVSGRVYGNLFDIPVRQDWKLLLTSPQLDPGDVISGVTLYYENWAPFDLPE